MVDRNSKRKGNGIEKIIFLTLFSLNLNFTLLNANNELYEKIDLFGEVLEKIEKDYVEDVNQNKMMDLSN